MMAKTEHRRGKSGRQADSPARAAAKGHKPKTAEQDFEPVTELPPCPKDFDVDAKEAWARWGQALIDARRLAVSDLMAFEMLCKLWGHQAAYVADIESYGTRIPIETQTGVSFKMNPSVAALKETAGRIDRLILQFGLTPASRSKVNPLKEPTNESDPIGRFLSN